MVRSCRKEGGGSLSQEGSGYGNTGKEKKREAEDKMERQHKERYVGSWTNTRCSTREKHLEENREGPL